MDSELPPFGIRRLYDEEPYSILQVSERQYQSTIASHPDATLSYIDEDDGENVIVGSGFELKQRLEETPTSNIPLVYCYDSTRKESEDRFIHLFDIKRTNTNRAVWKEHQAYHIKRRKEHERLRDEKEENDSISSIDINAAHQGDDDTIGNAEAKDCQWQIGRKQASTTHLTAALSEAIPDLVENLANLLQSTSDTLRKAAAKSRETDRSPVEDVLSGVGNIVAEIGSFGLNLLDKIENTTNDHSNEDALMGNDLRNFHTAEPSLENKIENHEQNSNHDIKSSVASLPDMTHSEDRDGTSKADLATKPPICNFCSTCRLQCRTTSESSRSCHNCATLGHPCSLESTAGLSSSMPIQAGASPFVSGTTGQRCDSILDQDTEDADFSRRYPPLISLRRANTIAGLHDRFTRPISHYSDDQGVKRHSSWAKRHPQRPVPQILDEETQRRRDFARNCFPTQRYTPGPGAQENKLPGVWKVGSSWTPSTAATWQDQSSSPWRPSKHAHVGSEYPRNHSITALDLQSTVAPSYAVVLPAAEAKSVVPDSFPTMNSKPLPGAWPDLAKDQAPISAPPGESSGAFFHRMMRDNPSRRQKHSSDTNERLTRYRSFSKQPSNNPFTELNRSHTVSSATNPASRLNRPFDPLYPILAPLDTSVSKAGPETKFPSGVPQYGRIVERQGPIPRPFSPVWEDHLNRTRVDRKDKNDDAAILDRKGESSSMYSPPPRHMRSVPSFATSPMIATVNPASGTTTELSPTTTAQLTLPPPRPISPFYNTPSKPVSNDVSPPSNPYQIMFQRDGMAQAQRKLASPPSSMRPPVAPKPPALRRPIRKSVSFSNTGSRYNNIDKNLDEDIQKCLIALRAMGYGSDDSNLNSRLHVYAAAAGGDILEAVDMIEEDKKANFSVTVEAQLREHKRRKSDDDLY